MLLLTVENVQFAFSLSWLFFKQVFICLLGMYYMQKSTAISVQKWYSLNSLSQSDFFSIWKVFFTQNALIKKYNATVRTIEYSLHVSIYTEREIAKFIFL